jgi:transcriptional regulator with XRE-family HTH domain
MKDRVPEDKQIGNDIAKALKQALERQQKKPEEAAQLLKVRLGTLYKYLAGDMIPGGQVLWRACQHLGMVLDAKGLRLSRRRHLNVNDLPSDTAQREFPFMNETIAGEKFHAQVRRKDNQYVRVTFRIKVAG